MNVEIEHANTWMIGIFYILDQLVSSLAFTSTVMALVLQVFGREPLNKQLKDHRSDLNSSSGNHEYNFMAIHPVVDKRQCARGARAPRMSVQTLCRSLQSLLRYFRLDQYCF